MNRIEISTIRFLSAVSRKTFQQKASNSEEAGSYIVMIGMGSSAVKTGWGDGQLYFTSCLNFE
jgi:hypothetical protein